MGCNSGTKTVETVDHDHSEGHDTHSERETPPMRVVDATLAADADLDSVVSNAIENISPLWYPFFISALRYKIPSVETVIRKKVSMSFPVLPPPNNFIPKAIPSFSMK